MPPFFFLLVFSMLALLSFGSYINNEEQGGQWDDFYTILIFTSTLLLYILAHRKKMRNFTAHPIAGDPPLFRSLLISCSLLICLIYFAQNGSPLFSLNPDAARMEFMTPDWKYKYFAHFFPFVMVYQTMSMAAAAQQGKKRKTSSIVVLIVLIVIYMLSGQKAGLLVPILLAALTWECAGRALNYKAVFTGFLVLLPVISYLFYRIAGTDDVLSGFNLFLSRVTSIMEFGLFASADLVRDHLLSPSDVFINIKYIIEKLNGLHQGYSPSFGRLVTSNYYQTSIDESLWELTPSFIADLYVLGGFTLTAAGGWLFGTYAHWLSRMIAKSKTLLSKSFFTYLLYLSFLDLMLGSVAHRLLNVTSVFIAIFLIWVAVGKLTQFNQRRNRHHLPAQNPTRIPHQG